MNAYEEKLKEVVELAIRLKGTSGGEALHKIIMDLQGSGPIAGLLHTLDRNNFNLVMLTLMEFRRSGREVDFNELHWQAAQAVHDDADE
jgi:hypothetical protein